MNDKKKIIQKIIPQIGQEKTGVSLHISLHSSSHHALTAKKQRVDFWSISIVSLFSPYFLFLHNEIEKYVEYFCDVISFQFDVLRRASDDDIPYQRTCGREGWGWGWWVVLLCWVCDSSPLPFLFSLLFVKSVGKWQNSNDHYYEWIDEMEYPLNPSAPPHNGAMHFVLVYNETCLGSEVSDVFDIFSRPKCSGIFYHFW